MLYRGLYWGYGYRIREVPLGIASLFDPALEPHSKLHVCISAVLVSMRAVDVRKVSIDPAGRARMHKNDVVLASVQDRILDITFQASCYVLKGKSILTIRIQDF